MINLALYQPDIPQNVGAAMRLCACLDVPLHIIEPCGFPWNDKKIRTSAMDYVDHIKLQKHSSWEAFQSTNAPRRLILMSTKTSLPYTDFSFRPDDILIAGSESSGVPPEIHACIEAQVTIPMASGLRSLNVINAAAMVLGEALRQNAS